MAIYTTILFLRLVSALVQPAAQPASRVASAGACVQHAPLLSVHGSAMGREPTPRGAIGRIEKLRETS